jgi:hypothetical protein
MNKKKSYVHSLADVVLIVYATKFKYSSGSPGYVGDLHILQGDALTDAPPIVLRRNDVDQTLLVA